MKKVILICVTIILCVIIISAPLYVMILLPKDIDDPVYSVNLTTEYTSETMLPYEGIQVLAKIGEYNVLLIDERSGVLYNVWTIPNGDIRVTTGRLR